VRKELKASSDLGHPLVRSTREIAWGFLRSALCQRSGHPRAQQALRNHYFHIARAGAPPQQTAADGGYASRANLAAAKARGIADVAFHKKCGIAITEMVKSPWVYRRLRNFRASIEAAISCFKRAYGAARCTWRGLDHFKAYIWSAVVAHNLVLFARL
jgi:IS5 family transposase